MAAQILKHSRQRDAIYAFLMTRKDHPTADVVYSHLRKDFPNISLGTVYRNLTLLSEIGQIRRLRLGDGVDHFDADITPHYHFLCSRCGSVIDLKMDNIDYINQLADVGFDGQIAGNITYFYGLCGKCTKEAGEDACDRTG
ncbi:MAG: transcriptional repressor [Lachnospiraceae bacterium]|nr:transcriptional repressor [Lachnospiraceae bacterium]